MKYAAEIEEIDVKFLFLVTRGPNINQNALATPKTVPISFYGKLMGELLLSVRVITSY